MGVCVSGLQPSICSLDCCFLSAAVIAFVEL